MLLDAAPSALSTNLLLAALVTVFSAYRLALEVAVPQPRLLGATFWLFVYASLGVASLAQFGRDEIPSGRYNDSDLTYALLLILITTIAFAIGQKSGRREPIVASARRFISGQRRWLIAFFGLICATAYIIRIGGPSSLFQSRESRRAFEYSSGLIQRDSEVISALWGAFGTVPILMALVMELNIRLTTKSTFSVLERSRFTVLLTIGFVVNNPLSNSRYWFITAFGSLGFIWLSQKPKLVSRAFIIAAAFALVIFPYSDITRRSDGAKLETVSISRKLATKDYDQLSMIATGISYVRSNGFSYGGQVIGLIGFAVPRSIWLSKPLDTGVLVGEWMGEDQVIATTNLSAPLWLEWYLDFGPIICGILFCFLGRAVRFLDFGFSQHRRSSSSIDDRISSSLSEIIYPVCAAYSLILLRGSLLQATARLVTIVTLAALFIAGAPRMRSGSVDEPSGAIKSPA